jgi:hypothetical protein
MNDGTGDRHVKARTVRPRHRQHHPCAGRAPQLAHDLADIHADDRLVVRLDDAIAGLDAGGCGRGAFDRRDDLRHAFLDGNLYSDPAELTARRLYQFAILALGHVVGMRVELAQHALQRAIDELVALDRRDIALLDLTHGVFHQRQIGGADRRIGSERIAAAGGKRDGEKGTASEGPGPQCCECAAPAGTVRQEVRFAHSSRSGWRFGCASAKASSFMQFSKILLIVG